jgi:hypothetical protein
MEISILESKQTLNIVECFLDSQPPCGIFRTTADKFLLPYTGDLSALSVGEVHNLCLHELNEIAP